MKDKWLLFILKLLPIQMLIERINVMGERDIRIYLLYASLGHVCIGVREWDLE